MRLENHNIKAVLNKALKKIADEKGKYRITIDASGDIPDIVADLDLLSDAIAIVFGFVVKSARENEEFSIGAVSNGSEILICLKSQRDFNNIKVLKKAMDDFSSPEKISSTAVDCELYLGYSIIESQSGTVNVDISDSGGGGSVCIRFPVYS